MDAEISRNLQTDDDSQSTCTESTNDYVVTEEPANEVCVKEPTGDVNIEDHTEDTVDSEESRIYRDDHSFVVAAIDLGTTYSGYAYSFRHEFLKDPTKVSTKYWISATGGSTSEKTPTCILFDQNNKTLAFGYDAEDEYTEKIQQDPKEAKTWSLFRRFKMELYDRVRINENFRLVSTNGNTLQAITVFAASIRYMIDEILSILNDESSGIGMDDIAWVLTVPAIWSDPAKKFMRVAAENAGIDQDRLALALEPEAASLYVRHIPFEKPKAKQQPIAVVYKGNSEKDCISKSENTKTEKRKTPRHNFTTNDDDVMRATFNEPCTETEVPESVEKASKKRMLISMRSGVKYMVLDAGGGTIDIAVHEMKGEEIREIDMANGGNWGGNNVDEAFRELLAKIVSPKITDSQKESLVDGREILSVFEKDFADDDLDLKRDFEMKKRRIKGSSTIKIKIPASLLETFDKLNPDAGFKGIDPNEFGGGAFISKDKIVLEPSAASSLFKEPIENIVGHLENIFTKPELEGTDKIMMVGGFSKSPLLVTAIRQAFPSKLVIVPREADIAVLKGAVIFGHNPNVFCQRISKLTYGVNCEGPFNEEIHPQEFKYVDKSGAEWCHNLFDVHVRAGDAIRLGEPQSVRAYQPSSFITDGVFNFSVFGTKSNNPVLVTDEGVYKAGQVTLKIQPEDVDYESDIIVSFTFSGTEITAVAEYAKVGLKEKSYIGYLELNQSA